MVRKKMRHELFDFMAQETRELQSEYERIRKHSREDSGTAGDEGEENWAKLLRSWLPSYYHVRTKGRILGYDGQSSPQIDVLVLHPAYPPILLDKKQYLSAGVVAAFECKLTLVGQDIVKATRNASVIRQLVGTRRGTPYRELTTPIMYGLLAHSHSWKGKKSHPTKMIEKYLWDSSLAHTKHPREMLDLICVSDLRTWIAEKYLQTQALRSDHLSDMPTSFKDAAVATLHKDSRKEIMTGEPQYITTPQGDNIITYPDDARISLPPVAGALHMLYDRLAWENPDMRPLSGYFTHVQLGSTVGGRCRMWPREVFSQETINAAPVSTSPETGPWDEWGYVL